MFLFDFNILRPPHETAQQDSLDWFVAAHIQSERLQGKSDEELALFQTTFEERLGRVGCKPDRIAKRGHILPDFLHRNWSEMSVYRLDEKIGGEGLGVRAEEYRVFGDEVFERFYSDATCGPDDLIHTTCTGYVSPSGAQKIVSKKGWGETTTVTHAYHMGCYGAVSSIRMGRGFLAADEAKRRVDIVHTEMCCLHSNPSLHGADQLVSQSLFADGFIKYSLSKQSSGPGFSLGPIREEIIPQSIRAMSWDVVEWGFQMSLGKEVPVLITRALSGYLQRLAAQSPWAYEELLQKALFAIHPGGPKILIHVQDLLSLTDDQMKYSYEILKNYGNMSSCTLPHIWKAVLDDAAIPSGTPVVSLAFGPGLTVAGLILVKQCG